jgi:hypothetical protein
MPGNFNHTKAAFYLVAGVFGVYALAAFVLVVACVAGMSHSQCPNDGRLGEIFLGLLASALAYAAGRTQGNGR